MALPMQDPRSDPAVEEPVGRVSALHGPTPLQATYRQLTNSAHRIMDIIVPRTYQPAKRSFFLARSPRTMKTGKATSTYRGIPGKHEAETRDMLGRLFLLQHRLSIPSEGRDCGQSTNCEISGPSAGYAPFPCSTGACSTEPSLEPRARSRWCMASSGSQQSDVRMRTRGDLALAPGTAGHLIVLVRIRDR